MLRAVLDTNQLVSSLLSTRGLQAQLIDAWRRRAYVLLLEPGQIGEVAVCRDPDDDYALGCAMAGAADYLVTGDADLLTLGKYKGVSIVEAREFLSVVG